MSLYVGLCPEDLTKAQILVLMYRFMKRERGVNRIALKNTFNLSNRTLARYIAELDSMPTFELRVDMSEYRNAHYWVQEFRDERH